MKLGEFGTFYKGKGITKADLVESGIPCLRYAEIYTKYDGIVNELSSFVSPDAATKATPIQSGDIIFAASGETAAEIGKAIAFVGHCPAVAGGDTVIFRNHGQESAYLAHVLNSVDAARQKARLGKGQSVVHIHVPELFQVEVPLPPLHEQRKIAEILATWDTAVEKTEELIAAKEKQFKWLLKTLISDQQDNPEWRKVTLGDACEIIVSPVDKKTVDGELPVKLCNYTDVYYNDAIGSEIDFMAATAKPSEIEKFSLTEGDVIITKDSETPNDIGVPAYVKETIDNLLCGYHLAILRPKKQTVGKCICYALTSPRVKYDFYRFANGITRFGLTMESYQKIKISLPILNEQKRIVNLLDTSKREIEVLKQLAEQYRIQKRGLMQKLLTGKWRIMSSFPRRRESRKSQ